MHGYGVSNAHHGEVRGCERACERNPLRVATFTKTMVTTELR
jgi:hypothetical protein